MKVKKGQDVVRVPGLEVVLKVIVRRGPDEEEAWPVLRVQPQTVARDREHLAAPGVPRYFIQSGEELHLFPTPNQPYEMEVVYYEHARRV